jgi:ketosteroid isomerase-like protein
MIRVSGSITPGSLPRGSCEDEPVLSDEEAVLEANAEFYAAFESGDIDRMADVWERSDRATVVHPGWPRIQGWAKVAASIDAIFRGTGYIQFFLTDAHVEVVGSVAVVSLDENILQASGAANAPESPGPLSEAKVAAVNVFVRDGGEWRLILHQGSPVNTELRDV